MENANPTATATLRQQQQQHFQLQQHQQEQQHENQQQFCLRWHNHQTSLLSTLPILLDQSHLTDVTLSAEGRTLRAHRVVLSACSSFFLDLFRTLDTTNHPVIILPGASFAAIVALLTFMYSGEVNVYEEQIPVLLNLAETLGVKGLADVQNNKSASKRRSMDLAYDETRKEDILDAQPPVPPLASTPTPPPASTLAPSSATFSMSNQPATSTGAAVATHAFNNPLLMSKMPSQLENFFLKSLQFYPNLLPQPLNFSQTALNKTTELLAKYQQQCSLYQGALNTLAGAANATSNELSGESNVTTSTMISQQQRQHTTTLPNKTVTTLEEPVAMKRFCAGDKQSRNVFLEQLQSHQQQQQQQTQHHQSHQQKDIKRIDKIVESLRCGSTNGNNSTNSNGNSNASSNRPTSVGENSTANMLHQLSTPHIATKSTLTTSSATTIPFNTCTFAPTTLATQLGTSKPPPIFSTPSSACAQTAQQQPASPAYESSVDDSTARSLQQTMEQFAGCNRSSSEVLDSNSHALKSPTMNKSSTSMLIMPTSPGTNAVQSKTASNSKLYATCFICHKQLSNQYNLRVHLETHQNVRYACNVCSHVSRSKDALRKHVSYRHPGAPSPCETEARRKRASKILLGANSNNLIGTSPPTSCASGSAVLTNAALENCGNNTTGESCNETQIAAAAAAAQLNSAAAYMFLPNQFHLAAAAAAVVQQQQQQQQQQHQNQQQSPQATTSQTTQRYTPPIVANATLLELESAMQTALPSVSPVVTATAIAPVKLEQHSPTTTIDISNFSTEPTSKSSDLPLSVTRSSPT